MSESSAERILAILSVFSEARPEWTPEELIQHLGYARPTLYRYVKTLREAGLLTALPHGGLMLGPKVVELDWLMRRSDPLLAAGRPHIERLARRHPATALLVRWYGTRLLCVESACSTPDPLTSYPRGRPMPISRGAIGRAILAFLPRRRQRELVARGLEDFVALGLGHDVDSVLDRLREVRRAGHAVAHGEVTPGVVGIAAPVFDAGPSPIAALCLTVAAAEIGPDRPLERLSAEVMEAAAQTSRTLGRLRGEPQVERARRSA
ncbi:MAG: hypothetical protein KatS3mg118_2429 [Paracoccaceae bacterium]|nr:MAG: IclR family transcriptional regulator [Alphaproteobacteria bacterium]GIX14470.1 MAG: hypothetical protein KatS3mg118_2429 [Paracoccaceae bacterium]